MTTTASAPTSAAWAASITVSAVVCAPQWTATEDAGPTPEEQIGRAAPLLDASRIPSPAVPNASSPSRPAPT